MEADQGKYWCTEGIGYKCMLCSKPIQYRNNLYAHVEKCKEKEKLKVTKPENQITKYIRGRERMSEDSFVKLLLWVFRHNISINSITDPEFKQLVPDIEIGCTRTIWNKIKDINKETKETLQNQVHNQYLSLSIDGAHINKFGFYVICGYLYFQKSQTIKTCVLDVHNIEKATSKNIVEKLKKTMENFGRSTILSVCTDNARNLKSIFRSSIIEPDELEDITVQYQKEQEDLIIEQQMEFLKNEGLGEFLEEEEENHFQEEEDIEEERNEDANKLDILRISCSVHTGQLVLYDVRKKNEEFHDILDAVAALPSIINKNDAFVRKCPLYQSQRWNSYYNILSFYKSKQEVIDQLVYTEYNGQLIHRMLSHFPLLYEVLRPLYSFTNMLEKDKANIKDVYFEYLELEEKWMTIDDECFYKKELLENLKIRFTKTFDLRVAQLASLLTTRGAGLFKEKYPDVPQTSLSEKKYAERKHRHDVMIMELSDCCQNICNIWKIPIDIWLG